MAGDFFLGGWLVQPSLNRISRADQVVRLEPKMMQVLICLAEAGGEVVTREALLARVWPDVHVTDDVLHRAVRELRRVLKDETTDASWIETIRKRGYRLVAPVPVASGTPPAAAIETQVGHLRWQPMVLISLVLVVACAVAVGVLLLRSDTKTEAHPRFVPLTADLFNEIDPALAPDGRRVAFVRRQSVDDTGQADLYLSAAAGSSPERLTATDADERLPVWSHDARRLAFLRIADGRCHVIVRDLGQESEQIALPCPNRMQPRLAWTRDGRLVISRADYDHAPQGWRIAVRSLSTGEERTLTTPPRGTPGDHSPVVSPDGRLVAFVRHNSGAFADVFVVPIEGGVERRVTFDDADLEGVAWTHDGRALVVSSDRAGGYTLWRVPVEGGPLQFVAGGAARMKHPVSSLAGDRLAYENWAYDINIWSASSARASRPVTRTVDLWNYFPQVAPDGQRVAYVSTASGAQEVWIVARDGSDARQLSAFGAVREQRTARAALRVPKWSPDGRTIAVIAHAGDGAELFLVDVASGQTRAISADGNLKVAPAWSPDGQRIYAGMRTQDQWDVWEFPVDAAPGGARLTIAGGYAATPVPDGSALLFTHADRAGLWRCAANGTNTERLVDDVSTADWANWTVDARGIFRIATDRGDTPVVEQISLDGRDRRVIATLDQLTWPGISVTPDGEVLYARWDRRQSRIMLLETAR